ncbi:ATP-dependent zinc metalloprotease FtsH [Kangiella sp. TOML190]|uniref:ATP-dependent zinc metalloprotease FtsH n=1 Tax=Kangiella sp. TOML190 TaxID=2931351 RepID=UPI00203D48AD|nr:ATP-dependent zinc metalloprotease FtsH [Kangiella sp. TOML190]
MNDLVKNILFWAVAAIILFFVIDTINQKQMDDSKIPFSEFVQKIENKEFSSVEINPNNQLAIGIDGGDADLKVHAQIPHGGWEKLNDILLENKVSYSSAKPEGNGLGTLLLSFGPILLLIGVWIYFMRQMQGGGKGGGALSFGKSKARMLSEDQVKTTFADVAGVEEAKEEVGELVDFLRDPRKYQKLGGTIPRGVLMVGPPGTGKTLLARAIAGEAKVPFFTISGSDFVEMFVGVGASRVRDMFDQAKKHAPCIIFIDEIDAVGRHRGAGMGGGHDEREQTLNQLLVEMDGFEGGEGVIVIAATNRPDVLDPALLRPGRFDRQVVVGLPDIKGREKILQVHMRKVPASDDVEAGVIARGTPGFSGADLANLVNEAALFAARENKRTVNMDHFEKAKDKIMMGAERRSMVMTEEEKLNTAYHEAGHAIVGLKVPSHDPVYKVSIIPRGRALGVTMYLPEQDRYSMSKEQLESQLSSLFGGRIAEEILNGPQQVTTGASNDIERATEIARNMVTKWGLSDKLGPLSYAQDEGEVFLGRSVTQHKNIADDTARAIDEEIRDFIDRNYKRAEKILNDNLDKLHAMSAALMKYETIDAKQIEEIMNGDEPQPPENWDDKPNGPSEPPKDPSPADTKAHEDKTSEDNEDGSAVVVKLRDE